MEREPIRLVTFVCQANINRSPVAQCIAEAMAEERGLTGIRFASAGLIEPPFCGLTPEMAQALRQLGYQPPRHVPRKTTAELLRESDLVLCFERSQVEQIRALRGEVGNNVYTLPEYAGFPQEEIPDPHRLIRKTLPSTFIKSLLPSLFRPPFYNMIGYVHPEDEREVLEVHVGLALQIESCVERAIEKIAKTH